MNIDWLKDGRKIPDEVMYYIRVMAVHAVRVLGQSPETVSILYHFNRHCIYRWLRQYDEGGYGALASEMPGGGEAVVTGDMDLWLKATVLGQTPVDFGYDTNLWACAILADLLKREFGVSVSEATARLHLRRLGLTPQKPEYRDIERDEREISRFLEVKFPKIQRLAGRMGADIGFQDGPGVGVMTRHGKTWGRRGETPIVQTSMKRGGYNVIPVVTTDGTLRYSIKDGSINGEAFISFLKQLLQGRERPLVLLVDHATFHASKVVRDFVRSRRAKLRVFFLPKRAPEMNPDEQVWNEIKHNRIGKQPVKDKNDLKKRLSKALASLQKNAKRILSFFELPDTKYTKGTEAYVS